MNRCAFGAVLGTLAVTATVIATLPALAAGDGDADGTESASDLFVQTATSGRLRSGSGDEYTLELKGVGPRMTQFSDRPLRLSASTTVQDFVDRWSATGFDADPPNAALVISDASEGRDTFILELTHPEYDADDGVLRYGAQLISEEPTGHLAGFADQVDDRPPGRFDAASLFIDNAPTAGLSVTVTGVEPNAFGRILVNVDAPFDAVFSSERIIEGGPGTILASKNAWGVFALQSATGPTSVELDGTFCVLAQGSEPIQAPISVSGATNVTVDLDNVPVQQFGPGDGTLEIPPSYFSDSCGD